MTNRDARGQLMPVAVLALVLLVFASAAIAHITLASWKSTLSVDADNETANVLASAINIVDGLAIGLVDSTGASRTPEQACKALHATTALPSPDCTPPDPALGTPAGAEHDTWTRWMSLPGRDGCVNNVLEGCWRARFAETTEAVQVTGRTAALALPVWTITIQAAARCDALPGPDNAKEVCVTVTEAVLTAETVTLPTFPTLLYSGRLWPEGTTPPAACDDGAMPPSDEARYVWCHIPDASRPPAGTHAQVSASDIAANGLFINDLPTFTCDAADPYCTIPPSGAADERARTVQSLPTDDLADGACTATPAVIAWTTRGPPPRPPGVTDRPTATLPADMPPADDPQMVVATGNVTITDNINGDDPDTLELEALLIVSGCHIIIDGPCVVDDVTNAVVVPSTCDPTAVTNPDHDPATIRRDNIALTNVVLVAAGGVWAADLTTLGGADPCETPGDTTHLTTASPGPGLPTLSVTGSVITGHAGATSRLSDIDCLGGGPPERKVVAGYARTSSLPTDTEAWATASVSWWPGREQGTWRRR